MRLSTFIILAFIVFNGALFLIRPSSALHSVSSYGKADIGGNFTLVDTRGHRIGNTDFQGKALLVYMGYSHCPDICPATLAAMAQALQLLGTDSAKTAFVFITLDPQRDTPRALGQFLAPFDPRIIGLTGSPQAIAQATKAYKVYYAKVAPNATGNYPISHSGFLYLMDKQGHYVTHFDADVKPQDIVDAVKKVIAN